jgi:TatA/E family protein of Tat protein translocase
MNLGPAEIIVVLVVALIVFGPKRLPEVGRQVGGALRELRKVQDTVRTEINTVINEPGPTTVSGPTTPRPRIVEVEPGDDHDEAMGPPPPLRRLDDPENGPSGSFS